MDREGLFFTTVAATGRAPLAEWVTRHRAWCRDCQRSSDEAKGRLFSQSYFPGSHLLAFIKALMILEMMVLKKVQKPLREWKKKANY